MARIVFVQWLFSIHLYQNNLLRKEVSMFYYIGYLLDV